MDYKNEEFAPKIEWNIDTEKGTIDFTVDGLTKNYVMLPDQRNATHAFMREKCLLGVIENSKLSLREIRENQFERHVLSTDLPPRSDVKFNFVKNLGEATLYLRPAVLVTPLAQLN